MWTVAKSSNQCYRQSHTFFHVKEKRSYYKSVFFLGLFATFIAHVDGSVLALLFHIAKGTFVYTSVIILRVVVVVVAAAAAAASAAAVVVVVVL